MGGLGGFGVGSRGWGRLLEGLNFYIYRPDSTDDPDYLRWRSDGGYCTRRGWLSARGHHQA
jgi:hypothetical protein